MLGVGGGKAKAVKGELIRIAAPGYFARTRAKKEIAVMLFANPLFTPQPVSAQGGL